MFTKHIVTKELLPVVHWMFREIFPETPPCDDGTYDGQFLDDGKRCHYLWKLTTSDDHEGKFIAMSAIYTEEADPDSLWLGWMGVLPEYRRERIATRIINDFLRECRKREYRYARACVSECNGPESDCLRFNGFSEEKYGGEIPKDILPVNHTLSIYSKSVDSSECPPWNDRKLIF